MLFSVIFAHYSKGACASDTPICTDICVDTLKQGGNAVDASVAATICIGTVSSQASGIGGGGFAVVDMNRKQYFVNFREMAPLASHKDMFTDSKDAQVGPLSPATPGELKGLHEIHRKFGHLKWEDLFRPSIRLAQEGFRVSKHLAKTIKKVQSNILADPGMAAIFTKVDKGKTVVVEENDVIKRPNFAKTLQLIAQFGISDFYTGSIAVSLVNFIQQKGGILTLKDFKGYRTEWKKPLTIKYGEYDVYTGHAPSGGPMLAMALKIAERYTFPGPKNNITDIHRIVEIMKHVYAKRSQLADPNFVKNVTKVTNQMKSDRYAMEVYSQISDDKTFPPEHYNNQYQYFQDSGTTHLSVLDKDGNSVSLTSTVNLEFGSCIMEPSTGIILNDQMDDFSIPNRKNAFALAPSAANYIAPLKRPQSSATPTVIKINNVVHLIIGGSGGSRIASAVFKTILDVLDLKMDVNKSIQSSRIHHQLFPNAVEIEEDLEFYYKRGLTSRGHILKVEKITFSAVQCILVKNGFIYAAADKRKNGSADGY
eukprot:NODE_50_length_27150_cov_0.307308.p3 type:complete len:538 gc:universal NODE_50_length_27150_cov_0.307308:4443-2830(-)